MSDVPPPPAVPGEIQRRENRAGLPRTQRLGVATADSVLRPRRAASTIPPSCHRASRTRRRDSGLLDQLSDGQGELFG